MCVCAVVVTCWRTTDSSIFWSVDLVVIVILRPMSSALNSFGLWIDNVIACAQATRSSAHGKRVFSKKNFVCALARRIRRAGDGRKATALRREQAGWRCHGAAAKTKKRRWAKQATLAAAYGNSPQRSLRTSTHQTARPTYYWCQRWKTNSGRVFRFVLFIRPEILCVLYD